MAAGAKWDRVVGADRCRLLRGGGDDGDDGAATVWAGKKWLAIAVVAMAAMVVQTSPRGPRAWLGVCLIVCVIVIVIVVVLLHLAFVDRSSCCFF